MGADSKPSAYIATRAQQGDPAAQTAYALRLWREGSGLGPETVSWLQSASEAGNLVARELLGTVYLALAARREGEEQSRFLDAAVDQLLLAVAQGSPEAMVNLAKLYLSGHFGKKIEAPGWRSCAKPLPGTTWKRKCFSPASSTTASSSPRPRSEPLSVCTGPQTQAIRKPSCSPCGKSSAPSSPSMISPGLAHARRGKRSRRCHAAPRLALRRWDALPSG